MFHLLAFTQGHSLPEPGPNLTTVIVALFGSIATVASAYFGWQQFMLARAKRRKTQRAIDAVASAMPVEPVPASTAGSKAPARTAGGAKSALVGGGR